MDGRGFDRFLERQRRQDARQPPRQHRLAGAGRPDHQQVVAAGGGDFERAARKRLAVKIGEIRCWQVPEVPGVPRCRRCRGAAGHSCVRLIQRVDRFASSVRTGQQAQARDDRGFGEVVVRQQQRAGAVAARLGGDRQHAARRLNRSVERQLADVDDAGEVACA